MKNQNNKCTPLIDKEKETRIEEVAERLLQREVLSCQSSLIDFLLKKEYATDQFGWEAVANLWPNTDQWTMQQCCDAIAEFTTEHPTPDPFDMDRDDLLDLVEVADKTLFENEGLKSLATEQLREKVIKLMDKEIIYGLHEWRIAASEGDPQEVFEWWLVTDWLIRHLDEIDEPILCNDYGNWWGRTCTGQAIIQDGTLQKIARRICS